MYWLLGRKSELSSFNKILLYKQVLKPIWIYGIQLWGCTKRTNVNTIQGFQNKVLRNIVNAPWYIRNKDIHRDLGIPLVADEIRKFAYKHQQRLIVHENEAASKLLLPCLNRRLKRTKPEDLVQLE